MFVFFNAKIAATKKAIPNPISAINDHQGKDCPKAAARKHTLECVRGRTSSIAVSGAGTWLKEKKVPHRKVIGNITKVLKVFMV